jgi:hypothetical protein
MLLRNIGICLKDYTVPKQTSPKYEYQSRVKHAAELRVLQPSVVASLARSQCKVAEALKKEQHSDCGNSSLLV